MPASRGRGQSAGLTRAQIIEAAGDIVADAGAGALSMRTLATRLDVTPNALYAHVDSKDDVIDGVLDNVLGEVRRASPQAADPIAALERIMTSTYAVLVGHRDLVPSFLSRQGSRGPNALALGDIMNHLLGRIGAEDVDAARRVLVVHAIGSAAFATTGSEGRLAVSERVARQHFDLGLRWLLAGIVETAAKNETGGVTDR
ncbi:TetR family transcriptional regulator [Epidermidibacterium keratini]|uniref:TetR family transcriptional regulator n=1 Tax=Epidermidibacterium keratini TaxID=1891644 RepID=A0A7L4YK73_9ACTN|nr:TetR/AcrR family transcriptional regulator [Epidermidibacterium keratini]QHB99243.1 TetR family transcriptional regulator [Epidermidibacterium keratini]